MTLWCLLGRTHKLNNRDGQARMVPLHMTELILGKEKPSHSAYLSYLRKETSMTKVLKCNDLNPGCTFEARGNTDEDVLKKAGEHAKTAHNMERVPPDVLDKARSAIRNEGEARGQRAG